MTVISSRDQTPEGHKTSAMGLHLARSAPKSLIDATSDDGPQYIANSATNKSVVTATKATRKSSEMPHYDGTLEGAHCSRTISVKIKLRQIISSFLHLNVNTTLFTFSPYYQRSHLRKQNRLMQSIRM